MSGGSSLARDNNRVPVIGGVSSADLSTPLAGVVNSVTQRLHVDATTDAAPTSYIVQDGTKLTVGTNVALQISASSIPCKKVTIYAYTTNRDTVAVGTSTVVAESSSSGTRTGRGEQLLQGAATTVYVSDVNKIWLTSATLGDGVSFTVYN